MWRTEPDRLVLPSTAIRNEVRVGASEAGRLLDTICYVASDATFKHCPDSLSLHAADTVRVTSTKRTKLDSEVIGFSGGGQLLVWLTAAVENCVAENIPDMEFSCISSLELFHVPHTTLLESIWYEISVRAMLSYMNGVVIMVHVVAQLYQKGVEQGDPIRAMFRIECTPYTAVSAIDFREHFDSQSMGDISPLLASLCEELKLSVQ